MHVVVVRDLLNIHNLLGGINEMKNKFQLSGHRERIRVRDLIKYHDELNPLMSTRAVPNFFIKLAVVYKLCDQVM
jgi:hypothetical protein